MECEHAPASSCSATAVGFALRACPFLKAVAAKEGDDFAARFSVAPLVSSAASAASARPPLEEQAAFAGFASSYSFFHGEGGVVPLVGMKKKGRENEASASAAASRCPFHAASQAAARSGLARSAYASEEAVTLQDPALSGASAKEQTGQETKTAREQQSSVVAASPWSSSSLPAASVPFAAISLRLFGGGMVSCV